MRSSPFLVVCCRCRQWQVQSTRDFLPPTNKQRYLFSFFLPFFFSFYFSIQTSYRIATEHLSTGAPNGNLQPVVTQHEKTYQFTLDLQTFSYCEIIKYSSIDFNSPRRRLQRQGIEAHIFIWAWACMCSCLKLAVKLLFPFRELGMGSCLRQYSREKCIKINWDIENEMAFTCLVALLSFVPHRLHAFPMLIYAGWDAFTGRANCKLFLRDARKYCHRTSNTT